MHEKREDENTYQVFGDWSRPKNTWVRRFKSDKEVWGEREVRKVNFESYLSFK